MYIDINLFIQTKWFVLIFQGIHTLVTPHPIKLQCTLSNYFPFSDCVLIILFGSYCFSACLHRRLCAKCMNIFSKTDLVTGSKMVRFWKGIWLGLEWNAMHSGYGIIWRSNNPEPFCEEESGRGCYWCQMLVEDVSVKHHVPKEVIENNRIKVKVIYITSSMMSPKSARSKGSASYRFILKDKAKAYRQKYRKTDKQR